MAQKKVQCKSVLPLKKKKALEKGLFVLGCRICHSVCAVNNVIAKHIVYAFGTNEKTRSRSVVLIYLQVTA